VRKISLSAHVGYGIPISGSKAHYVSGSNSSAVKDFADFMTIGGIEVSVAIGFRITREE